MLISIGVLARNAAAMLEGTLASLFGQDVFRGPADADARWEIIVVPNGCTDDTAARARAALATHAAGRSNVSWAVHELEEAGKSNAWNRYIHDFASREASVIVMLDSDIEFGHPGTVGNTVKALLADPHAVVAVDLPLKDSIRKSKKTLLERMSLAASRETIAGAVGISGQFFCARADALRQVWMPKGLSVEDGFLRAMIVTDSFRAAPDERKVIRAPDASHYYETLTSVPAIVRHELRIVIGTALNCYLAWDFLQYATDPQGPGAGTLIFHRTKEDPAWYRKLMANAIRNRGWWVLPRGMFFGRFTNLKEKRGLGLLRSLPMATARFLVDVPVLVIANHKLKSENAIGYW
jgi:glycosyltransferase involved in cell wall biosynthesis